MYKKAISYLIFIITTFSLGLRAGLPLYAVGDHSLIIFVEDKTGQIDRNLKIDATYGGYLTTTNAEGQIQFPRQSSSRDFDLIITPQIKPLFSVLNNILGWQIVNLSNTKSYKIKANLNNSDELSWEVSDLQIADPGNIPLHSIIILANPGEIELKIAPPTPLNEQLVLPSLVVDANIERLDLDDAVRLPNYKPFLRTLKNAYTLMPYGYATLQAR